MLTNHIQKEIEDIIWGPFTKLDHVMSRRWVKIITTERKKGCVSVDGRAGVQQEAGLVWFGWLQAGERSANTKPDGMRPGLETKQQMFYLGLSLISNILT